MLTLIVSGLLITAMLACFACLAAFASVAFERGRNPLDSDRSDWSHSGLKPVPVPRTESDHFGVKS